MTSVLYLWPLLSVGFFLRLTLPAAVAATIIGGYLLLPGRGGFDLPLLPAVGKTLIASLSALVLAAIFARKDDEILPGLLPRSPVLLGLIGLLVVGAFGTALTNTDALRTGGSVLQGMRLYDGFSMTMNSLVGLLAFLMGRKYLASPGSHRTLLIVLAVAGFGYSMLALYEIRMSPQLNRIVYGYFPHDWHQHVRDGGFRPVVFLPHALWLAIFLSCCTLAAFALWRIDRTGKRKYFLFIALWLLATLVLAKNFGAVVITFALLPLLLFLPVRMQILAAAALAGTLTLYPVLRAAGLVPIDEVVSTLREIAPERIGSLEFRLRNEDVLLEKANERPVFGWGGYNRNRLYDENGRDITVTDGEWIITFSQRGWVGYIGDFGILTFAVFVLAFRWRRYQLDPATAALSLVLAANFIDMIPNATSTNVTLLIAGALAGRLEVLTERSGAVGTTAAEASDAPATAAARSSTGGRGVPQPGSGPRFTRFPAGTGPHRRPDLG